jgi:hypothetical protein
MKPFIFSTKQKTNFPDFHPKPKRKIINWWEGRNFMKSKTAKRAILNKELRKELDEYEQDN